MGDPLGASVLREITAARMQMKAIASFRDLLEAGPSRNICDTVGLCWLSKCRDPRDKIYAILGMLPESQASEICVDYAMPWERLYEQSCALPGRVG
jgi:hypothetical protein